MLSKYDIISRLPLGVFFFNSMKKKRKTIWRLWAKALGDKSGKNDRESDIIAWIRTLIFISYLVTNVAIVANAVRHWNDIDYNTPKIERNYS